jgi:hypothetical protein
MISPVASIAIVPRSTRSLYRPHAGKPQDGASGEKPRTRRTGAQLNEERRPTLLCPRYALYGVMRSIIRPFEKMPAHLRALPDRGGTDGRDLRNVAIMYLFGRVINPIRQPKSAFATMNIESAINRSGQFGKAISNIQ